MPSLRQYTLLAALWAVMAWFTVELWGLAAHEYSSAAEMTRFYALRAPIVGALAGVIWAPVLCAGHLPGRASALAHRPAGLAVESPTRRLFRLLQGGAVGQLVGMSVTFGLLFVWPRDWWNSSHPFVYAKVLWGTFWYLFVPCCAAAGVLSVWVAVRYGRRLPKEV